MYLTDRTATLVKGRFPIIIVCLPDLTATARGKFIKKNVLKKIKKIKNCQEKKIIHLKKS